MTTTVFESASLAPAAPNGFLSTVKRIDRNARSIVYWTLVGFGVLAPLVGGLAGMIKALVT